MKTKPLLVAFVFVAAALSYLTFYLLKTSTGNLQPMGQHTDSVIPKIMVDDEYRVPDSICALFMKDILAKELVYTYSPMIIGDSLGFGSGGHLIIINGERWKWDVEYLYECKTQKIWKTVYTKPYCLAFDNAILKAIRNGEDLNNSTNLRKLFYTMTAEFEAALSETTTASGQATSHTKGE